MKVNDTINTATRLTCISLILFQAGHTIWNRISRSVSITVSFPKFKNICKTCIQSDHLMRQLKADQWFL